jgi:hypothetical protein
VNVLVFNPGNNSLRAGIVCCGRAQRTASAGTKIIEVIVEGIGKEPKLSVYCGKKTTHTEPILAGSFDEAGRSIIRWLEDQGTKRDPGWGMD